MRSPKLSSLAALAALVLGATGCADVTAEPRPIAAHVAGSCELSKRNYDRRKHCPQPPAVVVPSFPGVPIPLHSPARLAASASGWLLVTDTYNNTVLRVNPATLLADQHFRVDGRPHAIGMWGDRIFVGNWTDSTVQVFDHHGRLTGSLGAPRSVTWPADLAVDAIAALVFVLDRGEEPEIKIFDAADGTVVGAVASGDLVTPTGVAIDPVAEEIVVSDAGIPGQNEARVAIYGYDGTFHGAVSGAGTCDGSGCSGGFSTPASVAVDASGRIYLVDNLLAAVLVYDRQASLTWPVRVLGGRDGGAPLLDFPLDVEVVGPDVLVTNKHTSDVVAFRGGAE